MEIRVLEYFVEIANQQSYTKAAQILHVSQPALSKTMRALEQELEVALFDHSANGVVLTQQGKFLLGQAIPLLEHYASLTRAMSSLRDWGKGAVVIGSSPLIGDLFLSDIMLRFNQLYPDINLDYQEKGHALSCEAVATGKNDLAVVYNSGFDRELDSELLYRDQMVAVFTKDDPLGLRPSVTFDDVREQRFFFYSNNYYVHDLIMDRCQQAGYLPNVAATHAHSSFLLNLLKEKGDMAILPAPYVRQQQMAAQYNLVPFSPYLPWELCLIYRKNSRQSFAVSEFMSFVRKSFQSLCDNAPALPQA